MDTPIKVSAEGRTFYICCAGCEGDIKDDAKSVIAKLDKIANK
jgi:Archaeal TRASH domain